LYETGFSNHATTKRRTKVDKQAKYGFRSKFSVFQYQANIERKGRGRETAICIAENCKCTEQQQPACFMQILVPHLLTNMKMEAMFAS
jgi:hypothetical protein